LELGQKLDRGFEFGVDLQGLAQVLHGFIHASEENKILDRRDETEDSVYSPDYLVCVSLICRHSRDSLSACRLNKNFQKIRITLLIMLTQIP